MLIVIFNTNEEAIFVKKEKGITLIALVITIIVLLILATVSISLVINNGILDKAKYGVDTLKSSEEQEKINIALSEYEMNKYLEGIESLKKYLISKFNGEAIIKRSNNQTLNITFINTGNSYIISDNDTSIIAAGSAGTKTNWTLYSDGELIYSGNGSYSSRQGWQTEYNNIVKTITYEEGITGPICTDTFPNCVEMYIPKTFNYAGVYVAVGSPIENIYYAGTIEQWCKIDWNVRYGGHFPTQHNLYCNNQLITDVVIPSSITFLKGSTFYATTIHSIIIPDTVTEINMCYRGAYGTFCKTDIEEIIIPANITITNELGGAGLCSYNNKLKTATINSSLDSVVNWFYECTNLEDVTLNEATTKLNSKSFYNCTALRKVKCLGNIDAIENEAFRSCGSFTLDLSNCASIPILASNSFYKSSIVNIVVPDNLYEEWKSDSNWSSLSDKLVKISEYTE